MYFLWKSSCRFFLTCDRYLLSGVTLRNSFRRSIDDFVTISDDAAKSYKVKFIEANLYVRKMTLNDDVVSAVEKTLLSSPASYSYLETITKTFLASTVLQSWKQEDVFSREPIRRLAICLSTNEAFIGSKQLNPFHFCKFSLEQICIYRNGLPVAESPKNTTDDKRLYFNTMSDLAYIDNGHGIKLSEYPSQPFYYGVWSHKHSAGVAWFYSPWTHQMFNFNWTQDFSCLAK